MNKMDDFSNFNFLLHLQKKELFEHLKNAESLARINFKECGGEIRSALEGFIGLVFKKNKVNEKDIPNSLDEQIDYLRDRQLLPKKLEQSKYKATYVKKSGGKGMADYYTLLRWMGNVSSHKKTKKYYPKLIFSNLSLCLKCFHVLLTEYYQDQIRNKKIKKMSFNENRMPVGKYFIDKAYIPKDKERSQCELEFLGHFYDSRERKKYAIIRQYDKTKVEHNFLLRNYDVFIEASDEDEYGILKGFARFVTVAGNDDNASSFYIYAQEFNAVEPKPLNNELLQKLSLEQRVQLCLKIAECFSELHNFSTPIYHRLLTHDSIVICESKGKVIPYVSKFDFGKLTLVDRKTLMISKMSFDDLIGTISKNAFKARKAILEDMVLQKYISKEWKLCPEEKTIDWEKSDDYSLGVLFGCIIVGDVNTKVFPGKELSEMKEDNVIPESIIKVIGDMASDNIKGRCSIDKALSVFQEELKKWKN